MADNQKRNDGSERAAFRKDANDKITSGEAPQLEFLVDEDGKWHSWKAGRRDQDGVLHEDGKPGFHSNEGREPGWVDTDQDASHGKSYSEGQPNYYAFEERSKNRSDGAKYERNGIALEKPAVEIDGVAVNKEQAELWESRGVLNEESVSNKPEGPGWNRQAGRFVQDDELTASADQQDRPEQSRSAEKSYESEHSAQEQSKQESEVQDESMEARQREQAASPSAGCFGDNSSDNEINLEREEFGEELQEYRDEHLTTQSERSDKKMLH